MAKKKAATKGTEDILQQISAGLGQVIGQMGEIRKEIADVRTMGKKTADELERVKTGDKDAFKRDAKPEDVVAASENRKGIDPKIIAIVDETLGTDFGIELAPLGEDRIGYLFTLAVPDRLNDNPIEQRPIMEEGKPGTYKRDAVGNVLMEDYKRPDRRSRMLSSADGLQAIREHCERVRAYMHAYYASRKQQMPTLLVK